MVPFLFGLDKHYHLNHELRIQHSTFKSIKTRFKPRAMKKMTYLTVSTVFILLKTAVCLIIPTSTPLFPLNQFLPPFSNKNIFIYV
jgi:hypothetical protein